jgi:hypothetical protein
MMPSIPHPIPYDLEITMPDVFGEYKLAKDRRGALSERGGQGQDQKGNEKIHIE